MPPTMAHPDIGAAPMPAALPSGCYRILGIPVSVESDVPGVLECVDASYMAFRASPPASPRDALVLRLRRLDQPAAYLVGDSGGNERRWPDRDAALLDLLDRLVHGVLARLQARGAYTIHAGAAVYRERVLLVVGRSGQGKTTLTLGLLRRGLRLLSDELAVIDPERPWIMPYHRSPHIRPGTIDLIPELQFLRNLPQRRLGGGNEWPLAPHDLERVLPGCLAGPAPLGYVILLDGAPNVEREPALTPIPEALATLELLRSTWAASVDFEAGLNRVGQLLDGVACARLRAGALDRTLDRIMAWLEANRG